MTTRDSSRKKAVSRKLDPGDVRIQYEFVQMITEHFSDVWANFDGDMGEMLVLGVIGQAQLGAKLGETEPFLSAAEAVRGVSASSIADVTRIPRQTVRRKLIRLEQKGLIRQEEDQTGALSCSRTEPFPPTRNLLVCTSGGWREPSVWRSR